MGQWVSVAWCAGKWTIPAAEMAEIILNAVGEFSIDEKPKCLSLVRVTIFQSSMLDDFAQAVSKKIEEKHARGIIDRMKGTRSFSINVAYSMTSSSPLNVLAVLALHPSLLLLGHLHHPL